MISLALAKWKWLGLVLVVTAPLAYHFFQKSQGPPLFQPEVAPPAHSPPAHSMISKEGAAFCEAYLLDDALVDLHGPVEISTYPHLDRISPMRPFGILGMLRKLTSGQPYQLEYVIQDQEGTGVKAGTLDLASDSGSWFYLQVTEEELKGHAGGQWKALLKIPGIGEMQHEFEVTLADGQKQMLADYEEARRQTVRVFAQKWVVFPYQNLRTYVTAMAKNPAKQTSQEDSLFQVAGLTFLQKQEALSDADILNGISYRGAAGCDFKIYRAYSVQQGWSDWHDVDGKTGVSKMLQTGWDRATGPLKLQLNHEQMVPCMRFHIQCRDGNWIVRTDEGDRFINGVGRNDQASEKIAAERWALQTTWKGYRLIDPEVAERLPHGLPYDAKGAEIRAQMIEKSGGIEANEIFPGIDIPDTDLPTRLRTAQETKIDIKELQMRPNKLFNAPIVRPGAELLAKMSEGATPGRADLKKISAEVQATAETIEEQEKMTMKSILEN